MTTAQDHLAIQEIKKDIKEIKLRLKATVTRDDAKSFATKDDLKSFATKDDLKSFATKDDLKRFATKDDLKSFATKDDLGDLEERLDNKLVNFKSEILNSVDQVMGELKAIRENQEVHDFAHSRINDELSDHEVRIRKLEKTPSGA